MGHFFRGLFLKNGVSRLGVMWPKRSRLVTVYLEESSIRKEHTMIEIGTFHNGASDLPAVTTPEGVVVNDGSLAEVHESYQRVLVGQVRQGILAERLGFDYWFMTEHHFMPEGPEFSPNPLLAEAAIAAQTKRIRFGQMANILPWWHPLRVAEQAAMLDVLSGGRLELDRKSTRLNSSHLGISYAVFCLKNKR